MRSNFTPFTRLSAGGLMLAAAAADIGCAAAEPRRSHARPAPEATRIEELGAPSGKGYDDIIVNLAPLVAAKPGKEARPAERPAAPAPAAEAPKIAVAAPAESAKPAPAVPVFLREPLPILDSEPVAAKTPEPAPAAAPQAESAAAPAARIASPVVAEEPAVAPQAEPSVERAVAPEAGVEAPKADASDAIASKGDAPAAEAVPAPIAEAAPPAQEDSESPLALWQALVAAVALAGLLVMKYLRRGPAVAKAAEPVASKAVAPHEGEAAPAGRFALGLAAARAKLDPLLAKFAALRAKKAAETAPQAEAAPQEAAKKAASKKPKTMDWTEVAAALRARFGGGKAAGEPAAAQSNRVIALVDSEARGRVADSWESSEDDGLELLEPGDASARTIVMNARRRLRAAQS